jgi:hypothetical protein
MAIGDGRMASELLGWRQTAVVIEPPQRALEAAITQSDVM